MIIPYLDPIKVMRLIETAKISDSDAINGYNKIEHDKRDKVDYLKYKEAHDKFMDLMNYRSSLNSNNGVKLRGKF